MAINFNFNTAVSAASAVADLLGFSIATDVVGIYDAAGFTRMFQNAIPMKAEVRETSQIMNHPVETGAVIADHHIINPIEINLSLLIDGSNFGAVYDQMKVAFLAATLLTVQTNSGVYSNMIIADMPHQESTDMYNVISVALHLKEVLYVAPVSVSSSLAPDDYDPENPTDGDTVQAGQKYADNGDVVPVEWDWY